MYRRISGWTVMPVLLVALVVLALGACGGGGEAGGQEDPEARPCHRPEPCAPASTGRGSSSLPSP